jgi:hypothetical protein
VRCIDLMNDPIGDIETALKEVRAMLHPYLL